MTARLALAIMTAALLATALPVAAEGPQVQAMAVEYDQPAKQSGALGLLYVSDLVLDKDGQSASGARPWIDLTAEAIHAVTYEEQFYQAQAPTTEFTFKTADLDPESTPSDFTAAQAHLSAYQAGFQVHVYRLDGTVAYTLDSVGGRFNAIDDARMGPGGFGTDAAIQGDPAAGEPRTFGLVERPGPWVEHYLTQAKLGLVLQGDFVVEMSGITLDVQGADKDASLSSGVWQAPVDPNAPPQTEAAAVHVTQRFVRLQLTGAVLEFATDGGAPEMLWAATDMAADFSGPAVLVDARGTIDGVALDHARHVLPANSRVLFTPQDDGTLGLQVGPAGLSPESGRIASVPAPASAALLGTGAVLALGIAVGIGLLRRLLRLPALADVETAIEEGEFRKAARLAARILARLPGSEEALLGRAIALSKSGRPQDVVTELTRHLALRPASDGTLHYVLGLAQLEAGRPAEGQASLREAVRLTPALHAEVAPRLAKAFSVAPTTTKETNGYA
ncbi:MAG: hypothetical protein QOJ26_484 [Thermoplasmata archaeon]|nr:hypothetical protein [Thermoplasmata archaeon]